MTTANNLKNQNPNGLGNLGQISADHANPWAVVEWPGTDRESIVMLAPTFRAGMCHLERNYTDDDCPADVMRRLPDGTLTTEF